MVYQLSQSLQDPPNMSAMVMGGRGQGHGGRGRGGRLQGGGRGRGRGHNIYFGSYSPEQWKKLSSEEKKRVIEGRQKSSDQISQQDASRATPGRHTAAISTNGADGLQSVLTPGTIEPSIIQGVTQASIATGDRRSNP
jgi:hypothetical protein